MTVLLGTGGENVDVSLVEGVRVCLVDILAFDCMFKACGAECDEGSVMMFLGHYHLINASRLRRRSVFLLLEIV